MDARALKIGTQSQVRRLHGLAHALYGHGCAVGFGGLVQERPRTLNFARLVHLKNVAPLVTKCTQRVRLRSDTLLFEIVGTHGSHGRFDKDMVGCRLGLNGRRGRRSFCGRPKRKFQRT